MGERKPSAQEQLVTLLLSQYACGDAVAWAREYDLPTLEAYWCACPDADWLVWLVLNLAEEWIYGGPYTKLLDDAGIATCGCCARDDESADEIRAVIPFGAIEALAAAQLREAGQ